MARLKIEDLAVHRMLEMGESQHVIGGGVKFVYDGTCSSWGGEQQYSQHHNSQQPYYQNSGSSGYWHDTSHQDYVPGYYWQHGDHVHYEPGYWNYHQTGHWHK